VINAASSHATRILDLFVVATNENRLLGDALLTVIGM
jgi:hypothetical protein